MVRVLFVCLGNICRSPTAHGTFEMMLMKRNLATEVMVDSAGTAGWHIGKAPDTRSILAAKRRGIDLAHLRARQVTTEDFNQFDYILAMDNQNLADLQSICPATFSGRLASLLSFSHTEKVDVPDPYYGGSEGFEEVLDLVGAACDSLLADITEQYNIAVP